MRSTPLGHRPRDEGASMTAWCGMVSFACVRGNYAAGTTPGLTTLSLYHESLPLSGGGRNRAPYPRGSPGEGCDATVKSSAGVWGDSSMAYGWLTPPSRAVFILSVFLALLALLVRYAHVAVPVVSTYPFETLLVAFLLLLAGNLFRGF